MSKPDATPPGPSFDVVRALGYSWVQTLDDFQLLLCSIDRRGAPWELIYRQLCLAANQQAYGRGPCAREAWIKEVTELHRARMPYHDWLNDTRRWPAKLATSLALANEGAVTDAESNAIYHKHQLRQYA